jgi:hypothetical protein
MEKMVRNPLEAMHKPLLLVRLGDGRNIRYIPITTWQTILCVIYTQNDVNTKILFKSVHNHSHFIGKA